MREKAVDETARGRTVVVLGAALVAAAVLAAGLAGNAGRAAADTTYTLPSGGVLAEDQCLGSALADGLCLDKYGELDLDQTPPPEESGPFTIWDNGIAFVDSTPDPDLVMQSDGNLVEYTGQHQPLWYSGTYSSGATLVLGSDDSLRIVSTTGQTVWTVVPYGSPAIIVQNPAVQTNWSIPQGATMPSGSLLVNDDELYLARMQTDGNFVIYSDGGSVPVWSSGTFGNPGAYLRFQDDGNIVIYTATGKPIWDTGATLDKPVNVLTLQDDGNLVVYGTGATPANPAPYWNAWASTGTRL